MNKETVIEGLINCALAMTEGSSACCTTCPYYEDPITADKGRCYKLLLDAAELLSKNE